MQNTKNLKANGPIRWGAFLPLSILTTAFVVYFVFFFDVHLKFLFQKAGAYANGAKVDIGYLRTSLWNASFEMGGIEVANPDSPMKNRIEIGKTNFKFLFRPLLSKKVLIQDASIDDVRYGTERKYSGEIASAKVKSTEPGQVSKAMDRVQKALDKKIEDSAVEKLTGLTKDAGVVSNVRKLGEESNSYKTIEKVKSQVAQSVEQWNKSAEKLPTDKTVSDYRTRLDALSKKRPASLEEFAQAISEADKLKKEVNQAATEVDSMGKTVSTAAGDLDKQVKSIDEAIADDVKKTLADLKMPSLDIKDLTPALLGPKISKYLQQATYWVELSRKYFPKKDKKAAKEIKHVRKKGMDIHFIAERALPGFLLEHASISSAISTNTQAGLVKGEIKGLNSDPPIYGKPTVLSLSGDFPASGINGFQALVEMDHTTDVARETAQLKASSFEVTDWNLSQSPDLMLSIPKAKGSFDFGMQFGEVGFKSAMTMRFHHVGFNSKSSNATLDGILKNVLKSLSTFEVTARVDATKESPEIYMASDLGTKLGAGIFNEFKNQISAVNEKVKKEIEAEVGKRKKEVEAQVAQAKTKVLAPIEAKIGEIKALADSAQKLPEKFEQEKNAFIKKTEEEQKKKLGSEVEKQKEKLKKSIKLPF